MTANETGGMTGGVSASAMPRHAVIDGFLPDETADALLAHALQHRELFESATVVHKGATYAEPTDRKALATPELGPARSLFTAAIEAHFDHLCKAVGLAPFSIVAWDLELAAHRDGGFFREHIDTMLAGNRGGQPGDRVISLVYYLHRPEARFTGGDLVLRPFRGDDEEARIAPQHNRLVAFPSFARHEVEPVHVPGNAWEDARFSVNCWLLRGRD